MDTYEWIHMSFAAKVANVVLVAKVVQISIHATGYINQGGYNEKKSTFRRKQQQQL